MALPLLACLGSGDLLVLLWNNKRVPKKRLNSGFGSARARCLRARSALAASAAAIAACSASVRGFGM